MFRGNLALLVVLLALHLPAFILVAAFYVDIPGSGALLLVAPLLQALGAGIMLLAVLVSAAARQNAMAWIISGAGAAAFVLAHLHSSAGF